MVSTLLLIVMVALAVLLVGVRVVGLTPYTVLSGSMAPTYPVGAMIYVRAVEAQDIQIGTPLTFTLPGGTVATHRVHELVTVNGETQYITKGDANDTLDPPVSFDRVIGTPVFSIPLLGYLSAWLQTGAGTGSCIVLVAVLLLVQLLPKGAKSTQPSPGRMPSQTRSESCP